jgi:hypothetical protein
MRIVTIAHVPPELAHEWLQRLRDFDVAHPGCHFEVMNDAPEMTLAEALEMVQLDPALTFSAILARRRA